jgi:hypothetical protein
VAQPGCWKPGGDAGAPRGPRLPVLGAPDGGLIRIVTILKATVAWGRNGCSGYCTRSVQVVIKRGSFIHRAMHIFRGQVRERRGKARAGCRLPHKVKSAPGK